MFASRLNQAILAKKSPLVVGLDPDITKFPSCLKPAATASAAEIADAIPLSLTLLLYLVIYIYAFYNSVVPQKPELLAVLFPFL